jgi:paraquat-inducible protein B
VEIVAYPERLLARVRAEQVVAAEAIVQSAERRHAFFERMVEERGMRAQLRSGSLLTGQLYVAFDYHPDAPGAKIDWSQEKPVLPVAPSTLPDIEAKLTSIVAKLDALPYEALGNELKKVLASTDQMVKDADKLVVHADAKTLPELNEAIEVGRRALAAANTVLKNTDATLLGKDAPGQQELRDVLQEVARAARSLRVLTDYLERHPESLLRGKTEGKP